MARLDVVAGEGKTGGGWGLADRGEALRTGGGAPTGGAAGAGWGGNAGSQRGRMWGGGAPWAGGGGLRRGGGRGRGGGGRGVRRGGGFGGEVRAGGGAATGTWFRCRSTALGAKGCQNQLSCISMQVWSRASSRFSSWLQAGTSQVRK